MQTAVPGRRLTWIAALGLLVCVSALASACGGGNGDDGATEAGTEPPPPTTTAEQPTGTTAFSPSGFQPRFTIEIPADWISAEDQPGVVQFFSGETSDRALTFSSALADASVAEAVGRMRGSEQLESTEPTDTMLAGNAGQVFDANVGAAFSTDVAGVDYLVVEGFQVRIWAVDVGGSTVVVIADAPPAVAEEFYAGLDEVFGTLRFGPA